MRGAMRRAKNRGVIVLAWAGFLALVFLHLDFWRPQGETFRVGWIPDELGYRLVWVALAWLYLLFVCAFVWRSDEE